MFEVRNDDGQVISTHSTNEAAQKAAQSYRRSRETGGSTTYEVFGPVTEVFRQ